MTSVSKWIPLLLVVTSEFKLCCNFFFFPLGQKPGESWASVVFFLVFWGGFWGKWPESCCLFLAQVGITASPACLPRLLQKKPSSVWQRHLFIFSTRGTSYKAGLSIYKDIMVYNSPVQYNVQIQNFCTVFLIAHLSNSNFLYLLHHILYQFLFQTPVQ